MKQLTNRRKFLASLAILTSTAAVGSAGDFFIPESAETNFRSVWAKFCRANNALILTGGVMSTHWQPGPPPGHTYQTGQMVCFKKHQLLAQPTYVYWSNASRAPSDIFITFFEGEGNNERLFTINCYELDVLLKTPPKENNEVIATMLQAHHRTKLTCKPFVAKTLIKGNREVKTICFLSV